MNTKTLIAGFSLFIFSLNFVNGQKFERHSRLLSLREQIIMKLDSIDQIFLSQLHSREHFEARKKLDGVIVLFDKRESELQERERLLQERERSIQDREQAMQDKERGRDHHKDNDLDKDTYRDNDRDRDRHKDKDAVVPISQDDMNQLVSAIDNAPFVQDKKNVLKTAYNYHYYMVDQVIRLASKFSFDNDRLDVVEMLYPKIIDLNKNYLLYNCFTFSEAKNKLEKFIEANNK